MDLDLTTARLRLRRPHLGDAPAITRYLNNFSVVGKLSQVPYPYAESDAEGWINWCNGSRPVGETSFAITLGDDELIGVCGLHTGPEGAEIGYWLGEPFWHRGFMTEAAAAVRDWFFAQSGEDRLHSGAFAFNKASLSVQQKLGFTETGLSTRHCLARRQHLRHIDTTLTRARWASLTGARELQANP